MPELAATPARGALLARVVRIFRAVDAVCALGLLASVAQGVLTGTDLFLAVDPGHTAQGWARFLAHAAIPGELALLSGALLAVVVWPSTRPRGHALAAVAVAVFGFLLMASSVAVPWALNQGLAPLLVGCTLIGVGMAAHAGFARWLWQSAAPAA